MDFILASASPRRVQLLEQVGLRMGQQFAQHPAAIDESRLPDECPKDYVLRMAQTKARVVYDFLQAQATGPDIVSSSLLSTELPQGLPKEPPPVLGADTTVVLGERIFTKPADKAEALETLLALSGRRHQVLSAVSICGITDAGVVDQRSLLSETWVSFKVLTQAQCEYYWATGEPQGKAG
ncbi:MAG: Maf family protein, partial [Porticoccaceae bacterium]|nr:Maf family protein [Porticoccaceae bacterium]